ncbi:MAG: chromate transporter [Acidaminococcaceae bacterium]|nr:chromate transporter [Acidaminococcaceae bacterium]
MKELSTGENFYRRLFISTFLISAFTVGGGYVIIPLLKAKFVDEFGWLEDKEALNLVAVAQAAPGVVAVNAAIGIGYKLAGLPGALTAVLATVLPPLLTLTLLSYGYEMAAGNSYVRMILKGMQCGAAAIIIGVAWELLLKEWRRKLLLPLSIVVFTFVGNYFFNVNIMYLIALDAVIGLLFLRSARYS